MARWGKPKQARLKRKLLNPLLIPCTGEHHYGELNEWSREGKVVVAKICENCTHIYYKDQIVKDYLLKKSQKKERLITITNRHIDLFHY